MNPEARSILFAGTFDPPTLGHARLVERALSLFERVVVGLARNINKTPLFDLEERAALCALSMPQSRVLIEPIDGLLVDEARRLGCGAILRGARSGADFDYEFPMASINRTLAPSIETLFLLAEPGLAHVSSSLVKEVARFGGEISTFVHADVARALRAKIAPASPS